MLQQHTHQMSIDDMIALEPRIRDLLSEANIPSALDYWHRYSHYKRLLSQHVGRDATRPELMDSRCYETMIAALVTALAGDER